MRTVLRALLMPFLFLANMVAVSALLLLGAALAGGLFYAVFWIVIHLIGLLASRQWTISHMVALRTGMRSKGPQMGITLGIVALVWGWVRTVATWRAMKGQSGYPAGLRFLSTVLRIVSPEGHAIVTGDETEHPAADMMHEGIEDALDDKQE